MFMSWLKNHDFKDYPLENRLFPPMEDRAYWQQYLGEQEIREAEKHLGCDWPLLRATAYLAHDVDGDRLAYETPHFARRHQLIALFLGELAENKGRFLPKLQEYLLEIAAMRTWVQPSHDPKHLCFDGKKPV